MTTSPNIFKEPEKDLLRLNQNNEEFRLIVPLKNQGKDSLLRAKKKYRTQTKTITLKKEIAKKFRDFQQETDLISNSVALVTLLDLWEEKKRIEQCVCIFSYLIILKTHKL